MDEFDLIEKYFVRPDEADFVIAGIGDDGAVIRPEASRELVTVIDTLVAGVHFPDKSDPYDVGYRAVAVNLSDIAAMGARPRWMTMGLTLASADESWVSRFAEGLHAAAAKWDVRLVGGDTTRGAINVVSIQMTGDVANGQAIYRTGAAAGDTIFISGTVGDAAAGLRLIVEGREEPSLTSRFQRPSPRVEIGMALAGVASAAIDLSDGLAADLSKLLEASKVGARIDLERLPLSAELTGQFDRAAALQFALLGGDDYELCFTVAAEKLSSIPVTGVTPIGEIMASGGLVCHDQGRVVPVDTSGYRHFR